MAGFELWCIEVHQRYSVKAKEAYIEANSFKEALTIYRNRNGLADDIRIEGRQVSFGPTCYSFIPEPEPFLQRMTKNPDERH